MAEEKNILTVNIVTPSGITYDHRATLLIARAIDGDLGIMASHEPIIAPLEISELRVRRADDSNREDCIAVNGGFLEFNNNIATVVADSAERARDIDLRRAEYAKQKAEENIEKAKESHDTDTEARARIALSRAINRINVSGHK